MIFCQPYTFPLFFACADCRCHEGRTGRPCSRPGRRYPPRNPSPSPSPSPPPTTSSSSPRSAPRTRCHRRRGPHPRIPNRDRCAATCCRPYGRAHCLPGGNGTASVSTNLVSGWGRIPPSNDCVPCCRLPGRWRPGVSRSWSSGISCNWCSWISCRW